jgi:prepilin-type processing-associated H-X9-DG protein
MRRVQCQNNLRQIGMALHQYETNHGFLPPGKQPHRVFLIPPGIPVSNDAEFSVHCYLLPYLDQVAIYNSLNFSLAVPEYWMSALLTGEKRENSSAMHAGVGLFLCPSDPQARTATPARNSYRGNTGSGIAASRFSPWPDHGNGAFQENGYLKLADFADGLSKTVAFSEKLCGDPDRGFRAESDYAFVAPSSIPPLPDAEWMIAQCRGLNYPPGSYDSHAGFTWSIGSLIYTLYNHAGPPNSEFMDCGVPSKKPRRGAVGARSYHPAGVNCLYADGRVRFVSDSIDLALWRRIGTRGGGETVDSVDF